jgi:mannose-6-phosphate isomerase-like protein (cupin superfamily)
MSIEKRYIMGQKLTLHDVSDHCDIIHGESSPLSEGPPAHYHNNYREVFIIIEGELEFDLNGTIRSIKVGESIEIPPKTIHTFRNKTNTMCKWININSPKGFNAFFKSIGFLDSEPNAFKRSIQQETVDKIIATALQFDMVIQFPKKMNINL